MPLQKMIELLGRCVRMHHVAVLLGEDVIEILPTVAEIGDMPILLQTVFRERFAEPFRNGDGADTGLGLWFFLTRFAIT